MAVLGSASPIKSIQRGLTNNQATYSVNVTITAVDMSKSFVSSSTTNGYSGNGSLSQTASVRLTTSTNLLLQGLATGAITTAWEAIEYV